MYSWKMFLGKWNYEENGFNPSLLLLTHANFDLGLNLNLFTVCSLLERILCTQHSSYSLFKGFLLVWMNLLTSCCLNWDCSCYTPCPFWFSFSSSNFVRTHGLHVRVMRIIFVLDLLGKTHYVLNISPPLIQNIMVECHLFSLWLW